MAFSTAKISKTEYCLLLLVYGSGVDQFLAVPVSRFLLQKGKTTGRAMCAAMEAYSKCRSYPWSVTCFFLRHKLDKRLSCISRFNKICHPSQRPRWQVDFKDYSTLAYRESNNVHLLITRPPEICVNLVFKHIHAASSYTICRQFVPFIYCPL